MNGTMVLPLIKAVQELSEYDESQQKEIEDLKRTKEKLAKRLFQKNFFWTTSIRMPPIWKPGKQWNFAKNG